MPLEAPFIDILADRAKLPNYDEWSACLAAAVNVVGPDWKQAVALADEAAASGLTESLLEDKGYPSKFTSDPNNQDPAHWSIPGPASKKSGTDATGKVVTNPALPDESRPTLTPAEKQALHFYGNDDHAAINEHLRGATSRDPKILRAIEGLQSAAAKAKPFAEPVKAYRGMRFTDAADHDAFVDKLHAASKEGTALRVGGFLSTSTDPRIAKHFASADQHGEYGSGTPIHFTIHARRGLDMEPHSTGEKELLLPHNSAFKVRRVSRSLDKVHVILDHLHDTQGGGLQESCEGGSRVRADRFVDDSHEHWHVITLPKPVAESVEVLENVAIDYAKQDPAKHAERIIQQVGRGRAVSLVNEKMNRIRYGGTQHTPEQRPAALAHYKKVREHVLELHEPAPSGSNFNAIFPSKIVNDTDRTKSPFNPDHAAHRLVNSLATTAPEHLAALASGTHGGTVETKYLSNGHAFVTSSGNGVYASREFEPHGTGEAGRDRVRLHNAYFRIDDDSPFKGNGVHKFTANQVAAVRAAEGMHPVIRTEAAGPGMSADFNGHYTWPRVGFEGKISGPAFRSLPPAAKEAMGSSRSVRKLVDEVFDKVPGTKENWQKKKINIMPMSFDTTPGSISSAALDKYAAARDAAAKMRAS